jgi:hypothetical protein
LCILLWVMACYFNMQCNEVIVQHSSEKIITENKVDGYSPIRPNGFSFQFSWHHICMSMVNNTHISIILFCFCTQIISWLLLSLSLTHIILYGFVTLGLLPLMDHYILYYLHANFMPPSSLSFYGLIFRQKKNYGLIHPYKNSFGIALIGCVLKIKFEWNTNLATIFLFISHAQHAQL